MTGQQKTIYHQVLFEKKAIELLWSSDFTLETPISCYLMWNLGYLHFFRVQVFLNKGLMALFKTFQVPSDNIIIFVFPTSVYVLSVWSICQYLEEDIEV